MARPSDLISLLCEFRKVETMKKHPMQPVEKDENGTDRFRSNMIVRYLLDNGGIDMNDLAMRNFTDADRQQFAMLIGYSVSGFGSLSYVDDVTYETAAAMIDAEKTETETRLEQLEKMLAFLKEGIREPMARLFEVHPDDLNT